MFLFMMVPLITPLNATAANVFLCVVGAVVFGIALGAVSNIILRKISLV